MDELDEFDDRVQKINDVFDKIIMIANIKDSEKEVQRLAVLGKGVMLSLSDFVKEAISASQPN